MDTLRPELLNALLESEKISRSKTKTKSKSKGNSSNNNNNNNSNGTTTTNEFEGKNIRQGMLVDFWTRVKQRMSQEEFIQSVYATTNNEQRIKVVNQFFKWTPFTPSSKNKFRKRADLSLNYQRKILSTFDDGHVFESIKNVNSALAFSTPHAQDMASTMVARSFLLHQFRHSAEALEDLEALTSCDTPLYLWTEAEDLRSQFKAALDRSLEEKKLDEKCEAERKKREIFVKDLFTLKSPSASAPSMEDFLQIQYNSVKGRFLVATQDVPIGTTLIVEKPFVAILEDTLNLGVTRCHHCHKKNLRLIACPNCVFALFCDENCRKGAASYHQYECPSLPDLNLVLLEQSSFGGMYFYMAYKSICLMGPHQMASVFKERRGEYDLNNVENTSEAASTKILGSDPTTGIYDGSSYRSVFHLAPSFKPKEIIAPIISLMLAKILETNTPFFDQMSLALSPEAEVDPDPDLVQQRKKELVEFIAELILHHYECFQVNGFGCLEIDEGLDGTRLDHTMTMKVGKLDFDYRTFGRGIFPLASLINHSCDPNVIKFTGNTESMAGFVAMKNIKKGEELTISYGCLFGAKGREERRHHLEIYNFYCDCIACTENWILPDSDDMVVPAGGEPEFCCVKCSKLLFHCDRTSKNMRNIALKIQNRFKCPQCKSKYKAKELLDEFSKILRLFTVCENLVSSNSPLQSMKTITTIMEYFQHNLIPPTCHHDMAQDIYADAVRLAIHFN